MKEPACRCSMHGRRMPSDGRKTQPIIGNRYDLVNYLKSIRHDRMHCIPRRTWRFLSWTPLLDLRILSKTMVMLYRQPMAY